MKTQDVLNDLQKRFKITNGITLLFRMDTKECLQPSLSFVSQGVCEDTQLFMCVRFQSVLHYQETRIRVSYYESQLIAVILQYGLKLLHICEDSSLYALYDSAGFPLRSDATVGQNGLESDLYLRKEELIQVIPDRAIKVPYKYRLTRSIQCHQSTTIAQLKSDILRDLFKEKYSSGFDVGFVLVLESAPVKALEDNQTVMQCNITDNTPLLLEHSGVLVSVTSPFFPTDPLPEVDTPFIADLSQRRARVAEWKEKNPNPTTPQKKTPSKKEAQPCRAPVCPKKTDSSFFVLLNVTSTVMKLSCSPSTAVSSLLNSGVAFVLRRKPTDSDLKDYFIKMADPSVQVPWELALTATLEENGVKEGTSLMLCKRSAKDTFSLRVKYNDTIVSVNCQPSLTLRQVAELGVKQLSLSESMEVIGITTNKGKKMLETKTVAENGLQSGTLVIVQLQRVIHVSILVDDKRVMLKVPPSLTVSEVVQRGLSSLWRRPVKESEIENICVIRASDPSFSLLAPTFTLEEKGIQDMEELLIMLVF
ncbi:hypothetical protein WA588_004116 [Blastocystis sp. NMH]